MMNRMAVILLALFAWTGPGFANTWENLGEAANKNISAVASGPALAVQNDASYVSFLGGNESESPGNVYMVSWNGSSWQSVGGCLNKSTSGKASMLQAVQFNQTPIVIWAEENNNIKQIYARQWQNQAWQWLGDKVQRNL